LCSFLKRCNSVANIQNNSIQPESSIFQENPAKLTSLSALIQVYSDQTASSAACQRRLCVMIVMVVQLFKTVQFRREHPKQQHPA